MCLLLAQSIVHVKLSRKGIYIEQSPECHKAARDSAVEFGACRISCGDYDFGRRASYTLYSDRVTRVSF
jgi:hypothetical protein